MPDRRTIVTCSYCGTQLPSGAMFCGECGRPVTARPHAAPPAVEAPGVPEQDPHDLIQAPAPVAPEPIMSTPVPAPMPAPLPQSPPAA